VSLPQHSAAPVLPRPAAYGQQLPGRPMGVRQHPGVGPVGRHPMAVRPAPERPAPRPAATFLTVAEVAAIMRVSKMTVYRLVHGGELPAARVGRSFRVPRHAVEEYLRSAYFDVG
jgi:excisionase family DNA binding protein